jgi:hypothetical protein
MRNLGSIDSKDDLDVVLANMHMAEDDDDDFD